MTKQQYEEFNNSDLLSEEEKERERELNSKKQYGLTYNQMLALTRKHKAARMAEDYRTMARIEYRLTGINFHWQCGKLWRGDYDEVIRVIKDYIKKAKEAVNHE